MSLDANSPIPIFQQIAHHIRRSVAAGIYRPGEGLPSTRALAVELAVNPNTVQRAYEQLEREGVIFVKRGVGLFVADDGAGVARQESARGLREAFVQAIRAGRFANVPAAEIERIFHSAMSEVNGQEPATGGAA